MTHIAIWDSFRSFFQNQSLIPQTYVLELFPNQSSNFKRIKTVIVSLSLSRRTVLHLANLHYNVHQLINTQTNEKQKTAILYPVLGLQLFRDYIYIYTHITNDNLISLAFNELKEETGKEQLQRRGFISRSYGTVRMCSLNPSDALWRYRSPFLFLFGALPYK